MGKKTKSFIKLDRQLIRVLGLKNAVIFCHLLGIQDSINDKRNRQDAIYQQIDRLVYDTGISKKTVLNGLDDLESLNLLHIIKHTEGNKNKYYIDKHNYNALLKIMDKVENTKVKKGRDSAKAFKKDVLILYQEYYKNNTKSSDNFNTTNKDLLERELKLKNNKYYRQFLSNCTHKPITINYLENDILQDSKTYQFIPLFFKDEYSNDEIFNILSESSNTSLLEHQILEYFLASYYKYYGKIHKQEKAPKIREILQTIKYMVYDYLNDYDNDIMFDVIDEYFNTPNKNNRDLTIYLLLSNDNGYYGWIDTLLKRLM